MNFAFLFLFSVIISVIIIKINFLDLNKDVQYDIMDSLDTEDVTNVMEAFPELSPLGVSIYQKRYKNTEMHIGTFMTIKYPDRDFQKSGDSNPQKLFFGTYQVILKALKHFGCVMQNLFFYNRYLKYEDISFVLHISKYINKYTSGSMVHLNLNTIDCGVLEQFAVPFENVEDLSFEVTEKELKIGSLPLNQFFPKLKQLKELWADADYSFIDVEFPNLESLN